MRHKRLLLAIAMLAVPLIASHIAFKRQPDERTIQDLRREIARPGQWQGKVAPDLDVELLDGSRFRLADHVGREVILLNFFATWCGPCKAEMPELQRFYAQHLGQPVLLIGVDAEERPEQVQALLRETHVSFPVGIDASGELQKRFGVEALPTTIVISADGRIRLHQSGAIANADVVLAPLVRASLETLASGRGISREAYLDGVKGERYPTPEEKQDDQPALSARAQRIAASMDCPCGCTDTLQKCRCATARKAKAKLASMAFEGRDDADVMREINREFCMKGMQ